MSRDRLLRVSRLASGSELDAFLALADARANEMVPQDTQHGVFAEKMSVGVGSRRATLVGRPMYKVFRQPRLSLLELCGPSEPYGKIFVRFMQRMLDENDRNILFQRAQNLASIGYEYGTPDPDRVGVKATTVVESLTADDSMELGLALEPGEQFIDEHKVLFAAFAHEAKLKGVILPHSGYIPAVRFMSLGQGVPHDIVTKLRITLTTGLPISMNLGEPQSPMVR